jgi:hypothetical protein
MTLERLAQFHGARPFRPFRLHVADGRNFDVTHPECLTYSPTGRTIVFVKDEASMEVFDLLLITSLESLATAKARRSR